MPYKNLVVSERVQRATFSKAKFRTSVQLQLRLHECKYFRKQLAFTKRMLAQGRSDQANIAHILKNFHM